MAGDKLIFWFDEIGQQHNDFVGKKGANLGEMVKLGMPVAPGFAISLDFCRRFLAETGTNEMMSECLAGFGKISDFARCQEASDGIRSLLEQQEMPRYLKQDICSFYRALCEKAGISDVPVSIRSSGPTSRPGMFDTQLNIKGEREVIRAVKEVWSSAFSPRALWYRITHDIPVDGDILGVVTQKFLNARSAGIAFSADPVTGDTSVIEVDAAWGLGEGVVGGTVPVDRFRLNKTTLEIQEKTIADKRVHITATEKGIEHKEVPVEKRSIPCVSEEELEDLAGLAKFLEQQLDSPQDIEWAIGPSIEGPSSERICLFQTRPVKFGPQKALSPVERLADILAARFK